MITSVNTNSVSIVAANQQDIDRLDMAQSVGMKLPVEFSVPEKPELAKITFKKLLDEDGNPREGLGVQVLAGDKPKVITVSSLTRSYIESEIPPRPGETADMPRRSVIDVLQGVETFTEKPSQSVARLAGKTFTVSGAADVWQPVFDKVTRDIIGYEPAKKNIYTISSKEENNASTVEA